MVGHIVYVFLFLVILSLLNKKWVFFLGFVALLWLFSFRTNEIPDTEVYQWMYDDPISRMDYNEIGYLFLGMAFKMITGSEFMTFYLSMVGLCLLLWYYGTQKILSNNANYNMLFLLFISFMGFFYMGVAIRNGISELLVFYGLTLYITLKRRKKLFYFLLFLSIATFLHKSSVFFIILLPLFKINLKNSWYYSFFIICFVVWLLSGAILAREIISEISKYSLFSDYDKFSSSEESAPNMLSLQVLINWIISFFAIRNEPYIFLCHKKLYSHFLKINMVGLIVMSFIWALPTSYRFYNMFFFFNFILLYLMIFKNQRISQIKKQNTLAVFVSISYFAILIHSFSFLLLY